jgi:hypothetical protein
LITSVHTKRCWPPCSWDTMQTTRALPAVATKTVRSTMSQMVRWMLPLLVSMCCRSITSFSIRVQPDPLRLQSGPSSLHARSSLIRTHRNHRTAESTTALCRIERPAATTLPYSSTLFLESPTAASQSSESQNTDPVDVTSSDEMSPRIKQRTRRRRTSQANDSPFESRDVNMIVDNGETTLRTDSASSIGAAVAGDSLETLDVLPPPPPPLELQREKIVEIPIVDVRDLVSTSGSSRSAGSAASRINTASSSSSSSSRNVEAPATSTTSDNSQGSVTQNSDNDPLARLLADAREMKLQENGEDTVEGTGTISKVLSTIVTADFFVVLALFVWFLAGVFCSYILKVSMCRAVTIGNDTVPLVSRTHPALHPLGRKMYITG